MVKEKHQTNSSSPSERKTLTLNWLEHPAPRVMKENFLLFLTTFWLWSLIKLIQMIILKIHMDSENILFGVWTILGNCEYIQIHAEKSYCFCFPTFYWRPNVIQRLYSLKDPYFIGIFMHQTLWYELIGNSDNPIFINAAS